MSASGELDAIACACRAVVQYVVDASEESVAVAMWLCPSFSLAYTAPAPVDKAIIIAPPTPTAALASRWAERGRARLVTERRCDFTDGPCQVIGAGGKVSTQSDYIIGVHTCGCRDLHSSEYATAPVVPTGQVVHRPGIAQPARATGGCSRWPRSRRRIRERLTGSFADRTAAHGPARAVTARTR